MINHTSSIPNAQRFSKSKDAHCATLWLRCDKDHKWDRHPLTEPLLTIIPFNQLCDGKRQPECKGYCSNECLEKFLKSKKPALQFRTGLTLSYKKTIG